MAVRRVRQTGGSWHAATMS